MDKIICAGKNYLKHAQELGDPVPTEIVLFLKPSSTLFVASADGPTLKLPSYDETHHEVELVFKIAGTPGAWTFSHYTIGLDLTLRALQTSLKKEGHPWEKSKVFVNASVIGEWYPVSSLDACLEMPFELIINGERRQKGVGRDMRAAPKELLRDADKYFPLRSGDLLFTGTPEGVGPLRKGDVLDVRGGHVHYSLTAE